MQFMYNNTLSCAHAIDQVILNSVVYIIMGSFAFICCRKESARGYIQSSQISGVGRNVAVRKYDLLLL